MVLPASQINAEHPTRCSGDGCNLVACTIWSSNHDPETPWYSCLDCQEEDFGGWPTAESGDLPLRVLEDGLRNAMVARCSGREEPSLPDLPSVAGGNIPPPPAVAAAAANDEDGASEEEEEGEDFKPPAAAEEGGGDDDEEEPETWELKKVFAAKQIKRSDAPKCESDECDGRPNRKACSKWVSNRNEPWFSCLDCQER